MTLTGTNASVPSAGAGGNGGKGGDVALINILDVQLGSTSLSGQVNVSGGGGGGGAGQNASGGAPGLGGTGGFSGHINAITANISVAGGIFASDGANGGNGISTSAGFAGGGGGGGGSLGAGGGGGASGRNALTATITGGGGGGGIFGGGGGGTMQMGGSIASTGGAGAGFEAGGVGGAGDNPGKNGGLNLGGSSVNTQGTALPSDGGNFGIGGTNGGSDSGAPKVPAPSAFLNGKLQDSGNVSSITIQNSGVPTFPLLKVGTATAPLTIYAYQFTILEAQSVFLAIPGSGISGTNQFNISSPVLGVNSGPSADVVISMNSLPGNTFSLQASNVGANGSLDISTPAATSFIVQGAVLGSAGSHINFNSSATMQIKAPITSNASLSSVSLQADGLLSNTALVSGNTISLSVGTIAGSIGSSSTQPFKVNAQTLNISADNVALSNAFVVDSSTLATTMSLTHSFGILSLSSAASSLGVGTATSSAWANGTFTNTNTSTAGGAIVMATGGNLTGTTSTAVIATGDISSSLGTLFTADQATLTLSSSKGNIGLSVLAPFQFDGGGGTTQFTASAKGTVAGVGQAFIQEANGTLAVNNAITVNALSLTTTSAATDIFLAGPVSSSNGQVSITAARNVLASTASLGTPANQLVSGASGVNLTAISGSIGLLANAAGNQAPIKYAVTNALKTATATINVASASNALLSTTDSVANLIADVPTLLSLSNSTGALTVNGNITVAPVSISYLAKTNLTIQNNTSGFGGTAGAGTASNISLTAGSSLNLKGVTSNVIAARALGNGSSAGGTISITTSSLAFAVPNLALSLNADAVNGAGGTVSVNVTGPQAIGIGIAGNNSNLTVSAQGQGNGNSGGSFSVTIIGALTVAPSPMSNLDVAPNGANANGGNISLAAGGALLVNNPLSTVGTGSGTGGNITVIGSGAVNTSALIAGPSAGAANSGVVTVSAKASSFTVGGSQPFTGSGIKGAVPIIASSFSITNQASITLGSDITLPTGLINNFASFNTAVLNNLHNNVTNENTLNINSASTNLTINGNGFGVPSSINLSSAGTMNIVSLQTGTVFSNAASISLIAKGLITFGSSTLTAATTSGAPGSITLAGSGFKLPSGSNLLTLNATGVNTADGNVSVTLTATTQLVLTNATTVSNSIDINVASSKSTAGGIVFVSNGGTILANPTVNVTPTVGITGSGTTSNMRLSVLAGQQGNGLIQFNSFTPSLFGNSPDVLFSSNSSTPFTTIQSVLAPNQNAVGVFLGQTLTANSLTITNRGGGIGLSDSFPMAVKANAITTASGKTGSTFIENQAQNFNIVSATSGGAYDLQLSNTSGITTVASPGLVQASSVSISDQTGVGAMGTFQGTLNTNATKIQITLSAPAASLNIADSSFLPVTLNTSNVGNGTTGNYSFSTNGALNLNGSQTAGTFSALAGGNISAATNTVIGVDTGSTTLVAQGTGTINTLGTATVFGTNITLQTFTGSIGGSTSTTTLNLGGTSVQSLNISSSGAVNINDSDVNKLAVNPIVSVLKSFSLTSNTAGIASIAAITAGAISIKSTNPTGIANLLGNLVANNGSLSVVAGGQINAGVNSPIQLLSTNGNITLQTTSSNAPIALGGATGGVTLHASATAASFGFVSIIAGTAVVPTAAQLQTISGANYQGVPISRTGTGQLQTNESVSAGLPTFTGTNQLNAFGRNIVLFNAASSSIISGQSAIITADPPVNIKPVRAPQITKQNSATGAAVSLNLNSPALSYSVSQLDTPTPVTIKVGSKNVTLNPSTNGQQKITAAEYLAAEGAIAGSGQLLLLNTNGVATGGAISSTNLSAAELSLGVRQFASLTLPRNVTLVENANLSLSNSLVNYGHIISNGNQTISDRLTYNAVGASIIAPQSMSKLQIISDALVNRGVIAANGSLTLQVPNILNSGVLQSNQGSISFTSLAKIVVNNSGGTISAAKNIDFRDSSYKSSADISINAGILRAQQINFNAGCANVDVYASNVSGIVNTTAASVHLNTNSPNLIIGNTVVSDDPLFANQGNLTINGTVVGPQTGTGIAISFIAGGNIVSAGGALDTSSLITNGGQINLIAGANFVSSGANQVIVTQSSNPGNGSVTGGLIDLTGGNGGSAPLSTLRTSSSNGTSGAITLIAFAGSQANSGTIKAPSTMTFDSSGVGQRNWRQCHHYCRCDFGHSD